ncbi:MAG: acetyl-CoA carboxylase biotin carboxylase subunit [Planctomycetes bacterium]|nr:acetyl-CoA carboxylase biotin carboxylase subunit [Planctomycetota bacterium]
MFRRVLIANRGEIAVRVAATLQQMGVTALAVYSDPDRRSLHVFSADEAYALDGSTSADTYLRGDKILDLALRHKADAVHPGYGFLAENAEFAQACADRGVTFIGPSPAVIRAMGDKVAAKQAFAAAGVPVVPGWSGAEHERPDTLAREAAKVGYPVLVKAAAGGGGKGMRVVETSAELSAAVQAAQREAKAAFGDSRVFLERYIRRPRHVEIQVFGDAHGNVVHLFERECSIQRRHQKIVEESPSPGVTPELRARMGEAAVRAAAAIGYTNAGTVEFMVDEAGGFYFLEVNTRLQVEHPVTELVTGFDLVRAQVIVAAGGRLPFAQEELRQHGHAVECRVYAEDPARGFLPSVGTLECFVAPTGPGVRVDSGVMQGSEVTVHYDPQLAKLISWGRTRDESLARMAWALRRFPILGVATNLEFLQSLIDHPLFRAGRIHTQFLEEHRLAAEATGLPEEAYLAAALTALPADPARAATGEGRAASAAVGPESPWHAGLPWRNA